jgi:competence protein ComEC
MLSYFNLKTTIIVILFTLSVCLPSLAKDLTVSYIDIGQGDSELIELPDGSNIMIDAGDKDGAVKLVNYLKERNITKLDLFILTHPHMDHYGGLFQALKLLTIGQFLDSGAPTNSTTYLKLLRELKAKQVKYKISRRGDHFSFGNDIKVDILAPEDPLIKNSRSDTNNASIVAKLTYNKVTFLFTGDMEEESQDKLLKEGVADLQADILKVAHHGSRYTSSNEFLKAVSPKVAIISSGTGNSYGHPHQEALDRLEANKITVYRTDLKGTIIVTSDGQDYNIQTKSSGVKISAPKSKTDLNKASNEELELLPGLNADKAAALVKIRPVKSWGQLGRLNLTPDELAQLKKLSFFSGGSARKNDSQRERKGQTVKTGKVNINTATLKELIDLPGIGEKTARKIISARPFESVEDLAKVPGISKNKVNKLKELFFVEKG